MTRVAVVDDDARARATLVCLLTDAGYDVLEAEDGEAGLTLVAANRVDIVLLDVNMPGIGGYEVCRRLRQRCGFRIGIIFVSGSRTEPFDQAVGLDLGADDYITKPYEPGELLARLRATYRRVAALRAGLPHQHGLTPRQLEVLDLLARGASPTQIASELHLSPATVKKHVERIMRTVGVGSRTEAISWAFREGIVRVGAPSAGAT